MKITIKILFITAEQTKKICHQEGFHLDNFNTNSGISIQIEKMYLLIKNKIITLILLWFGNFKFSIKTAPFLGLGFVWKTCPRTYYTHHCCYRSCKMATAKKISHSQLCFGHRLQHQHMGCKKTIYSFRSI